jgi:hypothetical protein
MARMQKEHEDPGPRESPLRANGLVVMGLLVLVGVGVTAGYLQWKAPEVGEIIAGRKRAIAEAPNTPEGRLALWLVNGAPQIHHRIEMMRFSAAQPWLVTHAVRLEGESPSRLAIYGVDLTEVPRDVARIEGLTVRVKLPRPRRLAVGGLSGDNAAAVPIAASEDRAPDGIERARYLLRFAFDGLSQALERDIPGARIEIEVGPEDTWAAVAAAK